MGVLNPQQEAFLAYYTDPKSETFGNAYQSAIRAKYAKEYAENITNLMPEWLSENMGRFRMLKKAEKVLEKTLDMETDDSKLLRIQQDSAKFVAERLGKKEYSTRVEQTGANGTPISVNIIKYDNSDTTVPVQTEEIPTTVPESDGQRMSESSEGVA